MAKAHASCACACQLGLRRPRPPLSSISTCVLWLGSWLAARALACGSLNPVPLGAQALAHHGASLRRSAVAQWEVRLRVPDASGAWRLVISTPTGVLLHRSLPGLSLLLRAHSASDVLLRLQMRSSPPTGSHTKSWGRGAAGHETGEDNVHIYREAAGKDGQMMYSSRHGSSEAAGPLDGQPILAAYPPLEGLQQKRLAARRHKTTYAYDFPSVFGNALRELWTARAVAGEPGTAPKGAARHGWLSPGDLPACLQCSAGRSIHCCARGGPTRTACPGRLVEVEELVMAPGGTYQRPMPMVPVTRPVGQNDVGVLAWQLTLRTPECPQGRKARP